MSDVQRTFDVCYVRRTSNVCCSLKRGEKIQKFDPNWDSLGGLDQEIQSSL